VESSGEEDCLASLLLGQGNSSFTQFQHDADLSGLHCRRQSLAKDVGVDFLPRARSAKRSFTILIAPL